MSYAAIPPILNVPLLSFLGNSCTDAFVSICSYRRVFTLNVPPYSLPNLISYLAGINYLLSHPLCLLSALSLCACTYLFSCPCSGLDASFLKAENMLFSFVALTLNTAGAWPQSRCPVNVQDWSDSRFTEFVHVSMRTWDLLDSSGYASHNQPWPWLTYKSMLWEVCQNGSMAWVCETRWLIHSQQHYSLQ